MADKKFWRCNVCNDIHYGINPPKICPTCSVEDAYVEITEQEAKAMMGMTSRSPLILQDNKAGTSGCSEMPPLKSISDMSKEEVIKALVNFAENNDFMVNPDSSRVELLLEGLLNNEKNHGLKYCPCRLRAGDIQKDLLLVCPCNFKRQKTWQEKGECWCGLFVRRKNG